MKKLNTKGFSPVELLLIIVVVGIIGFVGWFVWHSRQTNENSSTTNSSSTAQTTAKKATETIFKNSDAQFSYYNDWKITDDSQMGFPYLVKVTLKSPNTVTSSNGGVKTGCQVEVTAFRQTGAEQTIEEQISSPDPEMKNVEKVTIAKQTTIQYDRTVDGVAKKISEFKVDRGSKSANYTVIEINGTDNKGSDKTSCDEAYSKLVNSFVLP